MTTIKINETVRLIKYPNDIMISKRNSVTGDVHKIWLSPADVKELKKKL